MNDAIDFSAPTTTKERLNSPVAKHRTSSKNGIAIADATERVPSASGKELVEAASVRIVQHRSFNFSTISRSC